MVLQISDGGMLLSSRAELDVSARGKFCLKAFEGEPEITVNAEVMHRLYEREPSGPDGLIKYGVRFLSPRGPEKAKISRLIRSAKVRIMHFDEPPEGA